MDPQHYWIEETYVRTNETDFQGRWKPTGFMQAMIEAASKHASQLGFGYERMMGLDMVWVLSRIKVRFYEFPEINRPVIIKTWPKGIQQKLFFLRDFDIRNSTGTPLAAASFAWLVINPKTRRIVSPQMLVQAFGAKVPDNGGASALEEPLEKLNLPDGLPERMMISANYNAIDILGHVTAPRYIEWLSDCFSLEDYRKNRLGWFQLNYINEIRPGERLSISAGPDAVDPARWYIQGKNVDTGQKSFDAEVGWC